MQLRADIDGENFGVTLPNEFYNRFEKQFETLLNQQHFFDWYYRGSLINVWAYIHPYEEEEFVDEAHMVILPLVDAATEEGFTELAVLLEEFLYVR